MAKKVIFVERRSDQKYKATEKGKPNAPIAVTSTQKAAIDRAKKANPEATIEVERVRDVGPGRDKWRKP
jgi:non-canonical (house-cleaning) NTP pyrophosphatase